MNWSNVVIGLGRVMQILSPARRSRDDGTLSRAIRTALIVAPVMLLLALPAGAGDSYPMPGFFADGLTAQSSWEQILKSRAIQAEFPMLNFGKSFVPLSAVCVHGDTLRIADPRMDNGVRLSVTHLPGQGRSRAGMTGYAAARANPFGVGNVALADEPLRDEAQAAPIRYPVSVYKVIPRALSTERVHLFEKPWEVPSCATP